VELLKASHRRANESPAFRDRDSFRGREMTPVHGIKSDDLVDSTNPAKGKEEMENDADINHDEDGMSWMGDCGDMSSVRLKLLGLVARYVRR